MKNYILLFLILIFTVSCYIQPETTNEDGGSISLLIKSDRLLDPPAGYDGEIKLRFYPEGVIDSLIDMGGEEAEYFSYLGELPSPLRIGGKTTFISPYSGYTGSIKIDGIPADTPLNVLVEHYSESSPYDDPFYFLTYGGLSKVFTVEKDKNTTITIQLEGADYGRAVLDFAGKYDFDSNLDVEFYEPEILENYITISGGNIEFDQYSNYYFYQDNYSESVSYPLNIDMIPGKKLRILVKDNPYSLSSGDTIGISGIFTLQPGLEQNIPVTFYNYIYIC